MPGKDRFERWVIALYGLLVVGWLGWFVVSVAGATETRQVDGDWVMVSVHVSPAPLVGGFLLALGVILCRRYVNASKG